MNSPTKQWSLATGCLLAGVALGFILKGDLATEPPATTDIRAIPRSGDSLPLSTTAAPEGGIYAASIAMDDPAAIGKKNAITPEDWSATCALNEREKKGEYILKWESPIAQKLLDKFLSKIVSESATTNAGAYDEIFSQLSIPSGQKSLLKIHLAKIHRASLEMEGAMQQLLLARKEFDKRLHDSLPEESYLAYREYEATKPASREYKAFRNYLEERGVPLPDLQTEHGITEAIKECQAHTEVTWSGPYDEMPNVTIGIVECTANFEKQIRRIENAAGNLEQASLSRGISDEYRTQLARYYADKIQKKRSAFGRFIVDAISPPSERSYIRKAISGK